MAQARSRGLPGAGCVHGYRPAGPDNLVDGQEWGYAVMYDIRVNVHQNSDGEWVLTHQPENEPDIVLRLAVDESDRCAFSELLPGCRVRQYLPDEEYLSAERMLDGRYFALSTSPHRRVFARMKERWQTLNRLITCQPCAAGKWAEV